MNCNARRFLIQTKFACFGEQFGRICAAIWANLVSERISFGKVLICFFAAKIVFLQTENVFVKSNGY